jgi:hypothetical protein
MARPSLSTAAITGSLLLGAGFVVHDATNHHVSPEPGAAPQAQAALALEAEGPCGVIQRFGAVRSDFEQTANGLARISAEPGNSGSADELQTLRDCMPNRGEIRYIIATVPHPTQTRLSLVFDRYVESILAAVNNAGYTFHSYWLPWTNAESSELKSLQDQKTREADIKARERVPGILLFRAPWQNDDKPRGLAVLLIGETPTSGIDETAFHHALQIIGPERKVAIIGPSFSGSFWSLRKLIQQYPNTFSVVTGSATVAKQRTDFEKWIAPKGDFTATVGDDDRSDRELLKHICQEWGSDVSIAIVSESATTYGVQNPLLPREPDPNPEGLNYEEKPACTTILSLTFPREISRLRNAYGEHPELTMTSGAPPPNPSSPQLPLDMRDPRPGHDGVPLLARTQTPVSQEGVLQSIVRTLRVRGVRFALLRATDPLDAIFLARYLRANCPDVRVLMETTDVLFVRAAREDPLDGTLSITTYPPYGRRRRQDTGDARATMLFPSQSAQGVYNATVLALVKSPGAVLPSSNLQCVGFDSQVCSTVGSGAGIGAAKAVPSSRPLWITVLTPGGYSPLAVIDPPKDGLLSVPAPNAPYVIFGFTLICLFAAVLFKVWSTSATGQHALLQWTALSAAAAAVIVLVGPFVFNLWFTPRLKALAVSSATLVVAGVAVGVARQLQQKKTAWKLYQYIPCGLLIAFAAAYMSIFRDNPHLENIFFARRSLRPLNGVSPALPILLLLTAAFWWAIAHLYRYTGFLNWREEHHISPTLACLGIDTHAVGNFLGGIFPRDIIPRIRRNLDRAIVLPVGTEQILAAVLFGTLILPIALRMDTFEPAPYNVLFGLLFTFVATAGAMSMWRFCRLWERMHKILRQLDSHRAREIFSAIGSEHSWSALLARADGECACRYAELARKIQASEGFGRRSPAFQDAIISITNATALGLRQIAPEALKSIKDELSDEVERQGYSYAWSRREAGFKQQLVTFSIDRRQELEYSTLELLALPAYEFILFLRRQMKNLLFLGMGIFVISGCAVLSYPFFESDLLDNILLAGFVIAGTLIIRVLVQADKDPILSAMNGTEPGKLGGEFFRNIFVFGVAPLLTIVAAYFPQVSRFLTSFVSASSLAGHGL